MASNLKVGDSVSVPGSMHGTLKYIGPVHGKKGVFAGVQLAPEFAARGKNSGDVEGKHYFRTSVPGSGIFLPAEKAEKRKSATMSIASPSPPNALGSFNQGGRASSAMSGSIPKPNFSQSIGPGSLVPTPSTGLRAQSPALRHPMRRESLPRPTSPLRRPVANAVHTPAAGRLATPKTRPSLGFSRSTIGAPGTIDGGLKSPSAIPTNKTVGATKFGQSLSQSTRALTSPGKIKVPSVARSEASTAGTSDTPLGPESAFDEEDVSFLSSDQPAETTPTPAAGRSFKSSSIDNLELQRLKEQLAERDRQLEEQSSSIAEMEGSLADLQQMVANGGTHMNTIDEVNEDQLPRDVQSLRAALRDKNEKVKALTAEFDANRADFRSTIDALEMASTETVRVYEKRVEDLLEELRGYQERSDDVESVAQQFRQLEELVQELEEGLEDARRGEAEARSEVEFLRGEVERSRSEMRRERERNRAGDRLNGVEPDGSGVMTDDFEELTLKIDQRDNEIRGLKAIIQNLNDNAASISPDMNKTPRPNGYNHKHSKTQSTNTTLSAGTSESAEHLQQQFRDLESLLDSGNFSEADLREEVQKLRKSVQFGASGSRFSVPGLGLSSLRKNGDLPKHTSTATSSTASTARPGSLRSNRSSKSTQPYQAGHRRKDTGVPDFADGMAPPIQEESGNLSDLSAHLDPISKSVANDTASISGKTDASSNVTAWCEICEEAGHDILTCTSMGFTSFDRTRTQPQTSSKQENGTNSLRPMSAKSNNIRESLRRSRESPHPPPDTSMPPPPAPSAAATTHDNKDAVDRPVPLLTGGSRKNSSTFVPASGASTNETTRKSSSSISSLQQQQQQSSSQTTSSSATSIGATIPPSSSSTTATSITTPSTTLPAPIPTSTSTSTSTPTASLTNGKSKLIEGTGDQTGMLAGKETGLIDPNKWCALCERDGHDSVDCPIEDAF